MLQENQKHSIQKSNQISILTKLYIWSVLIEPLIFFIAFGHIFGISTNISRILQLFVLLALLIKIILYKGYWRIPNPLSLYYRWYFTYFLLAIFSGFYGAFIGAYSLSFVTFEESLNVSIYRPLFEYVIAFYYFFYFVVLSRYLIRKPESIDYFFKMFKRVFFFTLYLGLFDLFLILMISEYGGIPRHLGDLQVGLRFHSIAGEPRDAFVYLILGLGILWAKDIWYSEKKLNKTLITIIILAALFTQSFSAIIGLIISIGILIVFFIPKLNLKYAALYFFAAALIIILSISYSLNFSPRINIYLHEITNLFISLQSEDVLSPIARAIINNIYPIWQRWLEIIQLDLLPLFFGTGLGSASVANANFVIENEIYNPNANIIRNIFETGIIGTLIIILAFFKPISNLKINENIKNTCQFLMIFILGAFLAHRSAAPFIFLGIVLIIFDSRYCKKFSK